MIYDGLRRLRRRSPFLLFPFASSFLRHSLSYFTLEAEAEGEKEGPSKREILIDKYEERCVCVREGNKRDCFLRLSISRNT